MIMADINNGDDDILMQRLSSGDDLALNEIMRRWKEPLLHFMARYISQHEEALDLAQETFVRVYQARERYKPGSKFSTWLFTIAANLCKNHLRWVSRHAQVSLDDSPSDSDGEKGLTMADRLAHPDSGPEDEFLAQERATAVRSAIRSLSHEQKMAIILFEYDDMPVVQIAEILECSPKAAENHLYRARLALKKVLERFING